MFLSLRNESVTDKHFLFTILYEKKVALNMDFQVVIVPCLFEKSNCDAKSVEHSHKRITYMARNLAEEYGDKHIRREKVTRKSTCKI